MSDSVEELSKEYKENVFSEHERNVGLFPIPEYPEFEVQRGMWSTALDVILTTLRYLAPATLLTLFWGQQSFLFKFLKYIDSAFRALIFSNEEQKQSILQWLAEVGPVRVEELDVVWRHGWIICGVLDTALPGACAGHPPTRLSLKHAQTIADHYLGVEPAFTRLELEANDSISRHQEWKLINYLDSIRLALSKLTPPASKTMSETTQKTSPETTQITLNYIARGSGLTAAQVNNKVYFKIYPTAQQSLDPGEITILINGPKETYGMTVIPPILGKAQMIRQNLLGLQSKSKYTDNVLPLTQGTAYLRNYGQNDMNKTFFIPKSKYDIEIETEIKQDHARIGYVANLEGKYEVAITSRGQNVVGSPFSVTASNNIISILERDSFCLEDGEEIDIVDVKSDRKVVLRIVDFVTEKMLLRENGTLERISEEEAKYLMENDEIENIGNETVMEESETKAVVFENNALNRNKFYKTANKILAANRFCNLLNDIKNQQKSILKNDGNSQDIPDLVNSTLNDEQNQVCSQEKRNRVIIPENISVSILTEKPKTQLNDTSNFDLHIDSTNNNDMFTCDPFEDDNMSVDTVQSSNNPFLSDIYNQNYETEKKLGSFITNEYESNNSQNEETANANINIFIDDETESLNENCNPFIDMERPKTPVCRIITGEVMSRDGPDYIHKERKLSNEVVLSNLINPFIDHIQDQLSAYQERPDFIIGAPVSLPPLINLKSTTSSLNNNVGEITKKSKRNQSKHKDYNCKNNITDTTVIPAMPSDTDKSSKNSIVYNSLDSNLTDDINITSSCSPTPSNVSSQIQTSRETSPKKDTWDSAYVSIDENNYSENTEFCDLNKKSPLPREHSKLNLNEREQLQNISPDNNTYKCEIKKSEFMPIIEENEKNVSSNMKDKTAKNNIVDPVTSAFAELNDLYDDYFKTSEVSSVTTNDECQLQNLGIDYTLERNDIHVDSASELRTDVKRQTKILEGKISEVQARVTESVSASQILHVKNNRYYNEENNNENIDQIQFGDESFSNIVLEKKKYWDEKIRQIEEKSEEIKNIQCKRRLTSKHLRRNDSLSKRKGKKIVQNFLNTNQDECYSLKKTVDQIDIINSQSDFNSVEDKIKSLNNNIEIYNKNEPTSCFGKKSSNSNERSLFDTFKQIKVSNDEPVDMSNDNDEIKSNLQLKQELSEKVFQAFETSPKRFFGTSRKHILNKIDTFLGNPDNENDTKKNTNDINHESGLVSSRISLFHNISKTEDLAWSRRKSKSMYNITHPESETFTNIKDRSTTHSKTIDKQERRKTSNSCEESNINYFNETDKNTIALKEKRARMTQNIHNKTFDETLYTTTKEKETDVSDNYVKRTIQDINGQNDFLVKSQTSKLKSISKSEMDIFNKSTFTTEDILETHKSYEELPKICVKNFISLYEDVSKTSNTSRQVKSSSRTNLGSLNNVRAPSSIYGTATNTTSPTKIDITPSKTVHDEEFIPVNERKQKLLDDKSFENYSNDIENTHLSSDTELTSNRDKDTSYISFSDIEIEIIEKQPEKSDESSNEKEPAHIEYKNRFTMARKYFQSLEELREERKPKKILKSESLISYQSTESLEENKKTRRKSNIKKSRSMPSSEISKIWNQMQENEADNKKLVKISEKFNVDDLFEDVMEGRLSRQGSLRGIPNKKAVLETFRSMENVNDNKLNSYEMAVSQLSDFAEENRIRNAQTYLSEYPYLPTTDPSKYHSRLDTNASGLITFKELRKIPRRNSVPDLRLNPTFTADL